MKTYTQTPLYLDEAAHCVAAAIYADFMFKQEEEEDTGEKSLSDFWTMAVPVLDIDGRVMLEQLDEADDVPAVVPDNMLIVGLAKLLKMNGAWFDKQDERRMASGDCYYDGGSVRVSTVYALLSVLVNGREKAAEKLGQTAVDSAAGQPFSILASEQRRTILAELERLQDEFSSKQMETRQKFAKKWEELQQQQEEELRQIEQDHLLREAELRKALRKIV